MGQFDIEGDVNEIRERLASLLGYSGFQVSRSGGDTLTFRKVRLTPSSRFPLSLYGSGAIKLRTLKGGMTRVTYRLHISPVTFFAYLVTGFSVVVLDVFANLFLLTSGMGSANNIAIGFLVLNSVAFLTILVIFLSFVKTMKRAERFLRSSSEKYIRS
nr:hypothetical protein [Candidatus Njordarchaeota archaeon]